MLYFFMKGCRKSREKSGKLKGKRRKPNAKSGTLKGEG